MAAAKIIARDVNVYYGEKHALKGVDVDIPERSVTAFIGPSGCGKSTFLRCINRMNDTIPICRVTGKITIDNTDIYDRSLDVVQLRARVGMVFQKPNPFPKSIFENIAYGPRIHGLAGTKAELEEIVTLSLQRAGLVPGSEGPVERFRNQPVGRPAAAAVHRPRDRRLAGDHTDGRALLRARSDRHGPRGGADRRAQGRLHDRHRHPQHAAGRPGFAANRVLSSRQPGRGGCDRGDFQQPEGQAHAGLHHRHGSGEPAVAPYCSHGPPRAGKHQS